MPKKLKLRVKKKTLCYGCEEYLTNDCYGYYCNKDPCGNTICDACEEGNMTMCYCCDYNFITKDFTYDKSVVNGEDTFEGMCDSCWYDKYIEKKIIDIGAFNGRTKSPTHRFLKRNGYKVYHVEPNIHHQEDLEVLQEQYNSRYFNVAVSDFNGGGKFYYDKRGFLSRKKGEKVNMQKGMRCSLEKEDEYINSFLTDKYQEVSVMTLDKLLERCGIYEDDPIELIKIDTEGTDYKILKNYSWRSKPKTIITEDFYKTNEDKYKLLESKGYKLKKKNDSDSVWELI